MGLSRVLRWIFLGLFAVAAVATGVTVVGKTRDAAPLKASIEEKSRAMQGIRERLMTVNIKYRGYLASLSQIPDSLRAAQAGIIKITGDEYRKQLFNLELEERENGRQLRRDQREYAAIQGSIRRSAGLLGGVALVALIGFFVTGRAFRSRKSRSIPA